MLDMRYVRLDGWQSTLAGEHMVGTVVPRALLKHKLNQNHNLLDRDYGYIRKDYGGMATQRMCYPETRL